MNTPFLLLPAPKDYIWGGSRLNDDFNLNIPVSPLAEAWMCSTHSDGESYVPDHSCTLGELLKERPELLGTHPLSITGGKGELPILIKLIDARSDLSVQVHPDDEYALKNEGSLGKSEMWYVLDAKKDASLIYGFNRDIDEKTLRNAISRGRIDKYLNHVKVRKNDIFFINAGTVHAIGGGCLIAEVQESSNLTYRLYDYDRRDKEGRKRELHIDKALEVMDMKASLEPQQPMRVIKYKRGSASEMLVRCRYFQMDRILLHTEDRHLSELRTGSNSFYVLLCVEGCGNISGEGYSLNFFKGDCIFVPADSIPLKLHGQAQLLGISS